MAERIAGRSPALKVLCLIAIFFGTEFTSIKTQNDNFHKLITGQEIVGVTAFIRAENGEDRAATLIAEMSGGAVCSMEIADTLPAGEGHIDKHEVITARGLVCDRVVDSQIPAQSVYLYGESGDEAYTDVDFELYGMSVDEIAAVRGAFALAKDGVLRARTLEDNRVLDRLMACVKQSAKSGKKGIA